MALARNPNLPNLPPVKQERYTAEQVAAAIFRAKGLVTVAARDLNCTPQTVRLYIGRYATVAAALKEARENVVDMAEAQLFKAISNGEPWAVNFALKTIGRHRGYIEKQQIEQAGEVTLRVVYGTDDPAS